MLGKFFDVIELFSKIQVVAVSTKQVVFRAYFRGLLFAVPARNALFGLWLTFSHSKNFKFICCLEGILSSNCSKFTKRYPFFIYTARMLCFLKCALVLICISIFVSVYWSLYILCVCLCMCVFSILNQNTRKPKSSM